MGQNLFQKIVGGRLVSGSLVPGEEIAVRPDQTLTQDALGTMAYLQFEAMNVPLVKTRSVSYIDHNTLQEGFENADDHKYLQTVADKHGILLSKPGNGICHQLHLERFSRPGEIMIGGDSHTPTCGAAGMLAIGAGGLSVAVAMAGGVFSFTCPKVIRVNLTGKLKPWCSAKDVVLEMLRRLTTKGNVNTLLEYGGPGVAALSLPERATIANMGTEMGVTSSMFPSDAVTRAFFAAQDRLADWKELLPDPDAAYERVIDLDLATVEPLAACPHSPDNVKPVRELAGLKVDQVLMGSCTNSSYRDLMIVASMLKGKKVHPSVSCGIAPGSRQVLRMIAENGALADLVQAGVRILESACGFCGGAGQAPQTDGVSFRTSNRNYLGRSGSKSAQVYLVSPESAVAAALTGFATDPRELGLVRPGIPEPQHFPIDDSMILVPSKNSAVEVFRGPNIGNPPCNTAMPKDLRAAVGIVVGDKITTDHIVMAGTALKYRSNVPVYAEYAFRVLDPEFPDRCRANREKGLASAIVAGQSYGQGSSREHAALCPMYLGVRLLLAKSVERIHAANCINFGILQLTFADEKDYDRLRQGDELLISDVHNAICKDTITVTNVTQGYSFETKCGLNPTQQDIVLAGGRLNYGTR